MSKKRTKGKKARQKIQEHISKFPTDPIEILRDIWRQDPRLSCYPWETIEQVITEQPELAKQISEMKPTAAPFLKWEPLPRKNRFDRFALHVYFTTRLAWEIHQDESSSEDDRKWAKEMIMGMYGSYSPRKTGPKRKRRMSESDFDTLDDHYLFIAESILRGYRLARDNPDLVNIISKKDKLEGISDPRSLALYDLAQSIKEPISKVSDVQLDRRSAKGIRNDIWKIKLGLNENYLRQRRKRIRDKRRNVTNKPT